MKKSVNPIPAENRIFSTNLTKIIDHYIPEDVIAQNKIKFEKFNKAWKYNNVVIGEHYQTSEKFNGISSPYRVYDAALVTNNKDDRNYLFIKIQFTRTKCITQIPYNFFCSGMFGDLFEFVLFNRNCCIGNVKVECYPYEYNIWCSMMGRCFDPNHPLYWAYGAMGVVPNIATDRCFENFLIRNHIYKTITRMNMDPDSYIHYFSINFSQSSDYNAYNSALIPHRTQSSMKELKDMYRTVTRNNKEKRKHGIVNHPMCRIVKSDTLSIDEYIKKYSVDN